LGDENATHAVTDQVETRGTSGGEQVLGCLGELLAELA
jgi:hypothetical protein